jgi:hypothetical protein
MIQFTGLYCMDLEVNRLCSVQLHSEYICFFLSARGILQCTIIVHAYHKRL